MNIVLNQTVGGKKVTKKHAFQRTLDGVLQFGKLFNLAGIHWEVVINDNNRLAVEYYVDSNNHTIVACFGGVEELAPIRTIVGQRQPAMFPKN